MSWTEQNRDALRAYRPAWLWDSFIGPETSIKWSFRDLANLEHAIRHCRGHALAVQAGGNVGLFPKRLAETFAAVHTFEPEPELYACLRRNAPEKNITAIRAALGNAHDPVKLACRRRDASGKPSHPAMTFVDGDGEIPQRRIDELRLPACDLIYLDVEGFELRALQGAFATIMRFRPVIAVEINGNTNHYGASEQELRDWIRARGYVDRVTSRADSIFVPVETPTDGNATP